MRAELKKITSTDIDFDSYCPEDKTYFSFPVEMEIGPAGVHGADLFHLTVCTPEWLQKEYAEQPAIILVATLLIFEYDWPKILAYIRALISNCSASDWVTLAQQLSRIARWEFAEYKGYGS